MIRISLVFFSKRIINLAPPPSVPPTVTVPSLNRAQFRVTCGHCNEIFMVGTCKFWLRKKSYLPWFVWSLANTCFYSNIQFHTTSHLARCPHCRRMWVYSICHSLHYQFCFNWSVVLIYVINVFISDLQWEIILLKHVPPFLLSLASSSWQQVLGWLWEHWTLPEILEVSEYLWCWVMFKISSLQGECGLLTSYKSHFTIQ